MKVGFVDFTALSEVFTFYLQNQTTEAGLGKALPKKKFSTATAEEAEVGAGLGTW